MAILFYRLFLWLYKCGAILLSPFNIKAKRWLSGRKDVFQQLHAFKTSQKGKIIWFHCASLGEFEQARPLIEKIRANYPAYVLLLSFFSPSGYEIRKDYKGVDFVTYLPNDSPENARRLLDMVNPHLVIWVKYEYWHYYLQELKKRQVPLLLVAGIFRKEQPFFKSWGGFHRNMLTCFSAFFVQNQESKKLLGSIGFSGNVIVGGDTRFDRVIEIAETAGEIMPIKTFIGNSKTIVAGSTWEEDEEELDHFANTHPEIKFVIAPHEIEEEHLKDIEKLFHHSIRYSQLENGSLAEEKMQAINTVIIDNIGMLSRLYQYATITYVGGGFGNDGVHNVLEAAVYHKPVLFGPVYEKFAEAVDLVEAGGAFSIENALELEETIDLLLNDTEVYEIAGKAAGNYVHANKGATEKILSYIQEKRLLTN
ncbi:MAG: glycosyltransferase N-terminal domain-containing protein [Chitinophagaceae bacterium]